MASIEGDFSTGLVAHYKLEESSGTRSDEVASSDLTDNNTVTQGTGKIDNCASFSAGNSEYLNNTTFATFSTTDDISVSCWAYFDDFGSSGASRGVWSGSFGNGTNYRYGSIRTYNNGGTVDIRYYYTAGSGKEAYYQHAVSGSFSTGEWVHVVFTVEYGVYTRMYINGSEVGTPFDISTFTYNSASYKNFFVGSEASPAGSPYAGRYMNGDVDEVTVWSTLLSGTDVSTIYNSGDGIEFDAPAVTTSIAKVDGIAQADILKYDGLILE